MSDEVRESTDPARQRLTPAVVQQQVFRRAMLRGYNEQDVDDFLDEITKELTLLLEEQRRLREQLQAGVTAPLAGTGDVAEAKRMADDIVQKARDEAAEIVRRARTEAAASAGGVGASALGPFLSQERVFLQDLSKLIQSHADIVRDMARARRQTAAGPPPSAQPEPPATPQPSQPGEQAAKAAPTPVTEEPAAAQGGSVKELFYGDE
jgi:DivIVA domain-containing protein